MKARVDRQQGRKPLFFLLCSLAIRGILFHLLLVQQPASAWDLSFRTVPPDAYDFESTTTPIKNAVRSAVTPLVDQYDALPAKGKFVTGALVGFAGSRSLVRATVGAVKGIGLAFVVYEGLQFAGVMEEWNANNGDTVRSLKGSFDRAVDECTTRLKQHVNPKFIGSCIKSCVERDKAGSAGFATGAIFGFVL